MKTAFKILSVIAMLWLTTSCQKNNSDIPPVYDDFFGEWQPPTDVMGAAHINFAPVDGQFIYFYSSYPYPMPADDIEAGFFFVDQQKSTVVLVNGKTGEKRTLKYSFSNHFNNLLLDDWTYTRVW